MKLTMRAAALLCLGLPVFTIAVLATPFGSNFIFTLAGLPTIFLVWVVAGLRVAGSVIGTVRRRAWRQTCGLLVVLALVLAGLWDPLRLSRSLHLAGDGLNLAVMEPVYHRRISRLPEAARSLVVFNRGGMIWASGGIVYDTSDQIMLPVDRRSAVWAERASQTELSCDPFQATALWDHFYTADFSC